MPKSIQPRALDQVTRKDLIVVLVDVGFDVVPRAGLDLPHVHHHVHLARAVLHGVVDDFRGVYYEPVTIVSILEPVFAEGAASGPLSLYASNGSQRLALAVSTAGQPADTQYTAFTSKELDPDPAKWTAAADSRAASRTEINAGVANLDIPASPDTLFVRIVASDHSIAKGTKLSALGL